MHSEVLTDKQKELIPLLQRFADNFGMVGGTAIALQIGHRRSIDFDMCSGAEFGNASIKNAITRAGWRIDQTLRDELDHLTVTVNAVQVTFLHYPYDVAFPKEFKGIALPDLDTLAAMKAYALGRRAKWKDYVDLFFIIERYGSVEAIADKGKAMLGDEFNERLLREQLSYFDDIDYSEEVEYMPGFETEQDEVKRALVEYSIA